jgi:nitrate/nitrite transport system substrate-binding protein
MRCYSLEVLDLASTIAENQLKVSVREFFHNHQNQINLDSHESDLPPSPPLQKGGERIDRLCLEVIQEAGGIEAAFSAAFGDKQGQLFQNTIRRGTLNRRKFLSQVITAAALVMLTNCGETPEQNIENDLAQPGEKLEKTTVKIGFIPITCATPIIMSKPLGFYEQCGLNVELVKMQSWSQVRDSAIAGELDAYHMLSPMPLAMSLGLGSGRFPIKLASIENINGNAITVAMKHKNKVKKPADFKGFTIAIPFVYSMHNLLLRYYLAAGGLNPDKDVNLKILPPPDMVRQLATGDIDAMIVAEPFNQQAVAEQVGFIHILTQEIWPGHPCCSFTAGQPWIDQHPSTFRALNKAIIDGCNYARNPRNRTEIARAISAPEYLNQPEALVEAVLTGNFDDGLGNVRNVPDRIDFDPYPWKSFSYWITTQFQRWNLMGSNLEHESIADEVFLTGLARHLAKQLGQTPPTVILRYEQLKYDRFDPSQPEAYLQEQIKKYGF